MDAAVRDHHEAPACARPAPCIGSPNDILAELRVDPARYGNASAPAEGATASVADS
jgi:hypothetical protein